MSTNSRDSHSKPYTSTRRVTLADVARRAGVSQTAASFVLTGRREEMRISFDVETRVLEAARETGYRPNIVSRSLRTGTTHTIGFISDTVATTPFAGNLIKGALEAARDRGHLLLIAETEGDPALEQELLEAMVDRQVDGLVLAAMYTRKVTVPKLLRSRASVLLNAVPTRPAPLVSVVPDELAAGRTAATTLLDAGHKSGIYLIGAGPRPGQGPAGSVAAVERLQGIKAALDEAGIGAGGAIACTDWEPELGHAAVRTLLDAGAPIKALVCFNDRLAVGAYTALAESSLAVGSDVSVISFDDDPISTWVKPELTTIAIPHYELGRRSIELLLDFPREGRRGGLVERVPMPVRLRGSVGSPAL
jgi:LacI family transcriptional regulator, galactose operon repressor